MTTEARDTVIRWPDRSVSTTFTLPWNTTRSLADVWDEIKARRDDSKIKPWGTFRKRGRPPGRLVSPKAAYAGREE